MTLKRVFYGLKMIKTYLRSTINQDRLTSMAVLNNENKNLDLIDREAIDEFEVKQILFFLKLKATFYELKKHTGFDPKKNSA